MPVPAPDLLALRLWKTRMRSTVMRAALCAALCAAVAVPLAVHLPAQAAVLGDVQVRSYLGQKLDAEIEVSSLTAAESEALLVRIPASDAFAAAGIDMTALVRSLRVTIEKRGDQTFVRLNSDQAVNDPFLMLLLELNAGGTRTVRQYALLIDPAPIERPQSVTVEPAIAEPQAPDGKAAASAESGAPSSAGNAATNSSTPVANAASTPATAPAANANQRLVATTTRRVRKGETLGTIANEFKPEGVRLEQVLVALQRANPQAFAGNNINRMKSGSVLSVPSAEAMRGIDAHAARRIVIAQSADFQRYREALAERMNIPAANGGNVAAAPAAGNRSSSGSVGVQVREPGARPEPQDQLKLTAPGPAGANGARNAAGNASGNSAGNAAVTNDKKVIDQVAADKALAEANSRIAALEKNLSRMEQMLELRDRKLADAQKAAELAARDAKEASKSQAAPAPAPAKSPAEVRPAETMAAETKPAAPAASTQRPWTDYLSDPLARALAAAAAVLALLAVLVRSRARRQADTQNRKRSKVNLVGAAAAVPAPETAPATGAEAADATKPASSAATAAATLAAVTGDAVKDEAAKGAALKGDAAHGHKQGDVKGQVQGTGKSGTGKSGAGEVDPVAEADVYIAYGRDEQAEEILRDALREQPQRHALRVKLLEIFAARRDRKGFADMAAELYAYTAGKGSAWEQAAQMGQMLDPGNALYGGPRQATPAAPATPSAQATNAANAANATKAADSTKAPPSSVDDFGLKLEGLLDEQRRGQGKATPPLQAPMQPPSSGAAPDFSLSGIGRGDAGGKRIETRIEPTLASEIELASLNTKLDLALACEEIGDHEGARELLAEVAAARDPELSRRAQDMLRKLA